MSVYHAELIRHAELEGGSPMRVLGTLAVIGAAVAVFVFINKDDIKRYRRMRSM